MPPEGKPSTDIAPDPSSDELRQDDRLDELCINTIRTLTIDAVQKANSGHPGTPMGLAPVVYTLWQRFLRFDPDDPIWPNRDRFVLSNGHASMLLYAMLFLAGVKAVDAKYERIGEPALGIGLGLRELERVIGAQRRNEGCYPAGDDKRDRHHLAAQMHKVAPQLAIERPHH